MTLRVGSRLGTYEILAPLGTGGMGEVYRARDLTLGRDVAIKILHRDSSGERFDREAHILATLNHPHIAAIYGLVQDDDTHSLVLELVEGVTLSQWIDRQGTPPPTHDALNIGHQIAEALEAAHEKRIIHRDLKPANIIVGAKNRIKVLDFGLAKILKQRNDSASGITAEMSAGHTAPGTVMGTVSYMSPEQARGRLTDQRTDLWSFGCVLFETLTGSSPFVRETSSDTIAAILESEPEWRLIPSSVPQSVIELLHRSLEKNVDRRLGDASSARQILLDALRPEPEVRRSKSWVHSVFGGLFKAEAAIDARPVESPPRSQKLTQITFAKGIEEFPSWSPDARQFAFTRETGGVRKVWMKSIDGGEQQLTFGDRDEIEPAWSPDGTTILFVRAVKVGVKLEPADVFGVDDEPAEIWSIGVPGQSSGDSATERRILSNAYNPAFSPDGMRIAFDASYGGPRRIWVADRIGHNPRQATTDNSEAAGHVRPRWSPDGARIVFQEIEGTRFDISVVDLATNELHSITKDFIQDLHPVWSPSGRFIYFSSYRGGGINVWRSPVDVRGRAAGPIEQVTSGAGPDVGLAISPDGSRLAFSILRQNAELWRLPVSPDTGAVTGAPEELVATTREDSRGSWSPDMTRIAFNSDRTGDMNIWVKSLQDGSQRQITRGPGGDFQATWSPDGTRLAFFSTRGGTTDIWDISVAGGEPCRLTRGPSIDVNPVYSPDGTRIAYQSDADGRLEVWMMNADGTAARQLTHIGVTGHFLKWSRDGASIYFRSPSGGTSRTLTISASGGEPQPTAQVMGGAHMSFSPDYSRIIDVVSHKVLWVSPLTGGSPEKIFEFDDSTVRIDYPSWSPDGRWLLFDRFHPQGGDIWMLEHFES